MKKEIFIFKLYLTISFILWGIAINFDFISSIPLSADTAFYLWCFEWWPHAITNKINPFLTKYFWAPFGQNLAVTTSIPFLSIIMWPVTKALGPVFSYNIVVILSLTLSAFFTYKICKELYLKELDSIFGGLIFLLSPYVWTQLLSHLNLSTIFFIPILIYLIIIRFKGKISMWKFFIIFSAALCCQFGISNEIYATLIFFLSISWLIFYIFFHKDKTIKDKINMLGIELLVCCFISILILGFYLYYIFLSYEDLKKPINPSEVYSSDPLNYLIPTPINFLGGEYFKNITSKFTGHLGETGSYLGLPLILLIILLQINIIKYFGFKDKYINNKFYLVLIIIFFIIVIFSFGPYLNILNTKIIPMPGKILKKLPLLKNALPIRFTVYTSFLGAILGAAFLNFLTKRKKWINLILILVTVIFLFPNFKLFNTKTKNVYKHIPSFITTEKFSYLLKRGDNLIIYPTYLDDGVYGPIWQINTKYYFNLSQQVAGIPPSEIRSGKIDFLSLSGLKNEDLKKDFLDYLIKCKVKYILLPDNEREFEKALDKFFQNKLKTDGVVLYLIR